MQVGKLKQVSDIEAASTRSQLSTAQHVARGTSTTRTDVNSATSEEEYLKLGPYQYWKEVPISEDGYSSNAEVEAAGQRINAAPARHVGDVESTPEQRSFIQRIARPTFEAQERLRPLTEFFFQGDIDNGTAWLRSPSRINQGGSFSVNAYAQFVAHWHYVRLDRIPGVGDNSSVRFFGLSGFVITPNNSNRCCRIFEVGRQDGKDVYRDITGKVPGAWQSRPDWNR